MAGVGVGCACEGIFCFVELKVVASRKEKICDAMCCPDGQQRWKGRYLGLHVWEEIL